MTPPTATKLYLVLVRSNTVLSHAISLVKAQRYTHIALSLDRSLDFMFSFARRNPYNPFIGRFVHEGLNRGLYGIFETLPGAIIELKVTPEQYKQASRLIGKFIKNSQRYRFNYLGLLGQAFNLTHRQKDEFFCAEFVYFVLHKCGILDLGRPPESLKPMDFLHIGGRIIYQGDLKKYPLAQKHPHVL